MLELKKKIQKRLSKSLYKKAYSRAFYTVLGVVIKEIRVSFRQFFTWRYPLRSLLRVIGIIASSILRLFLGRSLKYSFGHTGEDMIIQGILKALIYTSGNYIDVGCNHPRLFSNTYLLYRRGWRGICIDANANLIKKYAFFRPRDIAIGALISNETETKTFYVSENDVLSTAEESVLKDFEKQNLTYDSITLEPKSLTQVLNACNAPNTFDLLSVDAEEHDFQVLKSLDLTLYKPRLIVIEVENFDLTKGTSSDEICKYLHGFD